MPKPLPELTEALVALHSRAGSPPLRRIVELAGGRMSPGTPGDALNGARLTEWPQLSRIVEGLGGDTEAFRELWNASKEATRRRAPQDTPTSQAAQLQRELTAVRLGLNRLLTKLGMSPVTEQDVDEALRGGGGGLN
jgi:hypothetical protein